MKAVSVRKTMYYTEHMDCAAEEQVVRMGLERVSHVEHLNFDLVTRTLIVYHMGHADAVTKALGSLRFGEWHILALLRRCWWGLAAVILNEGSTLAESEPEVILSSNSIKH